MSIGEQIKAARLANGLSLQDLAGMLNSTAYWIRRAEENLEAPSPQMMNKLRQIFPSVAPASAQSDPEQVGRYITVEQVMACLDRNFAEADVSVTVRRYNKILMDLGFMMAPDNKAAGWILLTGDGGLSRAVGLFKTSQEAEQYADKKLTEWTSCLVLKPEVT